MYEPPKRLYDLYFTSFIRLSLYSATPHQLLLSMIAVLAFWPPKPAPFVNPNSLDDSYLPHDNSSFKGPLHPRRCLR